MKKTISILLALTLTFCLFPYSVSAAGSDDEDRSDSDWDEPGEDWEGPGGETPAAATVNGYHLLVNGEYVSDENLTVVCGKGKATFEPKTNTLTLENAEFTKTLSFGDSFEKAHDDGDYHPRAAVATDLPEFTVAVKGENTFGEEAGALLRAYGSVTFTGSGSLSAADQYASIEIHGNVAFQNAAITGRLCVHGGDQGYEPFGALTVRDSALTDVDLYAGGDVVITNSTLEGEKREGQYYALNPVTDRYEQRSGVYYMNSTVKYCGAKQLTVTDSRLNHTNLYGYTAYVGAEVPSADLTLKNVSLDTASLSASGGVTVKNLTAVCTGRTDTENGDRVNRISADAALILSETNDLKYTYLSSGGNMTLENVSLTEGKITAGGSLTVTDGALRGTDVTVKGDLRFENVTADAKNEKQASIITAHGDKAEFINCDFGGIEKTSQGARTVLLGNGIPMTQTFEYKSFTGAELRVYPAEEPYNKAQAVLFQNSRMLMDRIFTENPNMRLTIDETRLMLCMGDFGCAGGFDYQKNVTLKGNIAIVTGYWGSDRESGIFIDYLGDYYTFDETTGEVCIYNQYGVRGFRQASEDPEAIGYIASREYADKVTKITVGDQVTWPQPEWFRGFDHLKELDFGDGVPYVSSGYPDYTLGGCKALEKVTIGVSTEYFNFEMFCQCPNLKTVIIKSEELNDEAINAGRWSFQDYNPDVKIYVPADQVERFKAGMGKYKDQIFPLEALGDPSVLPQPADYMPGDVDLDKHITAADARLALRRSVDLETYAKRSVRYRACDVDRDGNVSAADARLILRASVGLEDASKWKAY